MADDLDLDIDLSGPEDNPDLAPIDPAAASASAVSDPAAAPAAPPVNGHRPGAAIAQAIKGMSNPQAASTAAAMPTAPPAVTPGMPAPMAMPQAASVPPVPQWSPAAITAFQGTVAKGGTMAQGKEAAQTAQQMVQQSQQTDAQIQNVAAKAAQNPAVGEIKQAAQNPAGTGWGMAGANQAMQQDVQAVKTGNNTLPAATPAQTPAQAPRTVVVKDSQGVDRMVDLNKLSPEGQAQIMQLYQQQQGDKQPQPAPPQASVGTGIKPVAGIGGSLKQLDVLQKDINKSDKIEAQQIQGTADLQKKAIEEGTKVAVNLSNAEAEIKKANVDKNDTLLTEHLARQGVMQKAGDEIDKDIARRDQAVAEYTFDPNRYLKHMSTGGKILSAISVMMGGMAQGLLHTNSNVGLDLLKENISRDVDAQKAEYDKRKDAAQLGHNNYAHFMEKYKNETDAYNATVSIENSNAARMIDYVSAQYGGDLAKAKAMQAKGLLQDDTNKRLETLRNNNISRALDIWKNKNAGQEFQVTKEMQQQQQRIDMAKLGVDVNEKNQALMVSGVGLARTPEDAKKANETVSTQKDIMGNLNTIRDLLAKHTSGVGVYGEDAVKLQNAAKSVRAAMMDNYGVKRFTEFDNGFMESVIKDPTAVDLMGRLPQAYNSLRDTAVKHYDNNMAQLMREGYRKMLPDNLDREIIQGGK